MGNFMRRTGRVYTSKLGSSPVGRNPGPPPQMPEDTRVSISKLGFGKGKTGMASPYPPSRIYYPLPSPAEMKRLRHSSSGLGITDWLRRNALIVGAASACVVGVAVVAVAK